MKSGAADFITLAQSDGTTTDYFAYDGLGSVRQLLDASGLVGLAQMFDAYGNGYAKAGSAQSTLGYTGEQTDSNGFVYLRARYYQPGMGRFTQMDPSRLEQNPYQYAAGNPAMFVDPSGLICVPYLDGAWECAKKIVAAYRTSASDLEALAQLFVHDDLLLYSETGRNTQDRLFFIINLTSIGKPLNFEVEFGETGLRTEFQDGCLYDNNDRHWARDPRVENGIVVDPGLKTNQIGHFLTAVNIAYNHVFSSNASKPIDIFGNKWEVNWGMEIAVGVAAVIGHEMVSDDDRMALQVMAGSRPLLGFLFMSAVADDLNKQYSLRDAKLAMVFYGGGFYTDDSTQWKQGNSLNDLKLDAKGFSFAAQARYGGTSFSRASAANWIRNELG